MLGHQGSSTVGKLAHINFSQYMGDMEMEDFKMLTSGTDSLYPSKCNIIKSL
ncbi:hypothetical protein KGM_207645 [Danaus plexippus plexippus]|uniref:Uncharacterized protein n=1 Tax=Danaus plexippus plexippus TaxID=278856 RepID=A0A212EQA1_DANPL|nr:hypothetical protein KGM_207645 [Danaus plexippus plexippus]